MNSCSKNSRVAVVGAGMSGLSLARTLAQGGMSVTLFDKGRSPGGRVATRRTELDGTFDHGAQYFTTRSEEFSSQLQMWVDAGVASEWQGRVVKLEGGVALPTNPQKRYVGVPGMSAIMAHLASSLTIHRQIRITSVSREANTWELQDESADRYGPFEILVVALPAPQTAELLAFHPLGQAAATVSMFPCWAVLVRFQTPYEVPWDGAFVHGSPLSWVCRNSSKPGRATDPDCWVLHATPDWAIRMIEAPPQEVCALLIEALAQATGMPVPPVAFAQAHRWRYSQGSDLAHRQAIYDPTDQLGICGDWLASGKIEGAYRSGMLLAEKILQSTDASAITHN